MVIASSHPPSGSAVPFTLSNSWIAEVHPLQDITVITAPPLLATSITEESSLRLATIPLITLYVKGAGSH